MSLRIFALLLLLCCALPMAPAAAQALPSGFHVSDSISGRALPTGVYFAHDGRVFVTEKNGRIWVYANLLDADPQLFADLSLEVHDNWDRGLLGFALDPRFPEVPYVYVQYAYNGGLFPWLDPVPWTPRWPSCAAGNPNCGVNGGTDYCPDPPGDTDMGGGCVIGGRVSRLTVSGNGVTAETVLLEDWYQQFPSHSIGTILFGPDGYLYAGGGDGASFNWHDFGQAGNPDWPDQRSPLNPSSPNDQATNQGGSLRAQGLEIEDLYTGTPGVPGSDQVWLNGSIVRIDPATGAGAPGNPLAGDPMPNAQRIVAYGLRNPFRFTFRPGTNGELWVGDVGENVWEEINRVPTLSGNPAPALSNFGWPCFEGRGHHAGFTGPICSALYSGGNTGGRTPQTQPWYTYQHVGGSDITGLAFYTGNSYPAAYQDALFFADNSRQRIFVIPYVDANADGIPDAPADSSAATFYGDGAFNATQLVSGPGGDLFYANIGSGRISRIWYCNACTNRAPSAAIALDAGSTGDGAPRTIAFTAINSVDPDADALTYDWDLDGDGNYGDASGPTASAFFGSDGLHTVAVQASDGHGGIDVARMTVRVGSGNTPPTVAITSPAPSFAWIANAPVTLAATSSDAEQGTLTDDELAWTVYREDCTNPDFTGCTESVLGNYTGANTSFVAPDAAFPAYLRIVLVGTDEGGLSDTREVDIYPATASVTLASAPGGLVLGLGGGAPVAAPHTWSVIVGAHFEVSAPSPQGVGTVQYAFDSWSDGGAATHLAQVDAPGSSTLTATFVAPADVAVAIDDGRAGLQPGETDQWTLTVDNTGPNALAGVAVAAHLPASLQDAHWTCSATAGSSCGAAGAGSLADAASLAVGGRVTYIVIATVVADASGSITVSAAATLPAGFANQDPADDNASDTDVVLTDVVFRDGFDVD
jgi:glucose/arabinose dehydrogenase